MIKTVDELNQSVEQLGRMYRILAGLRARALDRNPRQFAVLAEGPVDEIRKLLAEIDAYTGLHEAQVHEADVWMQLQGPRLSWPDIPVSVLGAFLDAFRKGVRAAAELLVESGQRPSLHQLCDFRVTALEPGSLRVGLRLPDEEAPDELESGVARRALEDYLEVAAWVGSGRSTDDLREKIGDPRSVRVLLDAVRRLAPSPRGEVTDVELSGPLTDATAPVRLTRASKKRIRAALKRVTEVTDEVHEGVIREIDLDRRTFILRNDDGQTACRFGEDLTDDARQGFDRRVRVYGTRRHGAGVRLDVRQISCLDSAS